MKRNLLLLFFVLPFANTLVAQNPLVKQWDYRFGGTLSEMSNIIQQTNDGGFLLGGITSSGLNGDVSEAGQGGFDYWMIKIDSLGMKQWDKRFGGNNGDGLTSILQTTDGGYLLAGTSPSDSSGDKSQDSKGTFDFWVVKADSNRNKQWDKTFGGNDIENLYSSVETSDRGFILGGWSLSGISGDKTQSSRGGRDYWIIKIDSLGNKLWDRRFGGGNDDYLYSMILTHDNGIILGGQSASDVGGDKTQPRWGLDDFWIVKIDSSGTKEWDKDFGGNHYEGVYSMTHTSEGGYILGGTSWSGISGDKTDSSRGLTDFWIVKIDSIGNKISDKTFGGMNVEELFSITQTTNNGYLLTGDSYSDSSGEKSEDNLGIEQLWTVKLDSTLTKQWDKTIFTLSTVNHDEGGLGFQIPGGCYVFAIPTTAGIGGYKTQNSLGDYDFWLSKFCDTTITTSINQISNPESSFSIYPNPTNSILNLSLTKTENITITNVIGDVILKTNAKGKVELDISFLSAGIYYIKVGNEVRKFVKE